MFPCSVIYKIVRALWHCISMAVGGTGIEALLSCIVTPEPLNHIDLHFPSNSHTTGWFAVEYFLGHLILYLIRDKITGAQCDHCRLWPLQLSVQAPYTASFRHCGCVSIMSIATTCYRSHSIQPVATSASTSDFKSAAVFSEIGNVLEKVRPLYCLVKPYHEKPELKISIIA